MKTVKTFTAVIYVGFGEQDGGAMHTIEEAEVICQSYVDAVGLCVTITPTRFIYTDGGEPGAVIGLINYPRFPASEDTILGKALELARLLMRAFRQFRASVVCSEKTYMLEREADL